MLACWSTRTPAILDLRPINVCLTSEPRPQSGWNWNYSHLLGQPLCRGLLNGGRVDVCCFWSKVKYSEPVFFPQPPPIPPYPVSLLLDPAFMCGGVSFFHIGKILKVVGWTLHHYFHVSLNFYWVGGRGEVRWSLWGKNGPQSNPDCFETVI